MPQAPSPPPPPLPFPHLIRCAHEVWKQGGGGGEGEVGGW